MRTWICNKVTALWCGLVCTDAVFSSTKFFSSVAYSVTTWVVVHQELAGTLSTELVLIYLGVVAGHNTLLRTLRPNKEEK